MTMPIPADPKIYHIVHADRLLSIIAEDGLLCDAEVATRSPGGTTIGMNNIKQRRLSLPLSSYPYLHVGDCAPFYFCPRSVMLYVIYKGNDPELNYHGGQEPIVHLEADLRQTIAWAEEHEQRWVFTTSNAGSRFFDDYSNLAQLDKVEWNAVQARDWRECKDGKQAEFLVERSFPWELVERIGVRSMPVCQQVRAALESTAHKPPVEIRNEWYY